MNSVMSLLEVPHSTNSKLSLFSTCNFFRYASLSFLSKWSFFSSYCDLCFSFYHSILKDDSATQFSCEQRHTVEVFFRLAWFFFFNHFNPSLSNTVNMKKYLS